MKQRVAVALVALLALTGCTENSSTGKPETGPEDDTAQIDIAMQEMTSELDDLAGITTQHSVERDSDNEYEVRVQATGPQLTTDQLVEAAVIVQRAIADLDGIRVNVDLADPIGVMYSASFFDVSEEALTADIEYSRAFAEAYGSPASVFFGQSNSADPYSRVVSVSAATEAPDWNAIRALPDKSPADRSWQVPGLNFSEVPGTEVLDLLDAIGTVAPVDSDDPSVTVDWHGDSVFVSVLASGVEVDDPAEASSWPVARDVAAVLAASSLPARSYSFYSYANQGLATVHFGDCAEVVTPTDTDTVLAEALGPDAIAGLCLV